MAWCYVHGTVYLSLSNNLSENAIIDKWRYNSEYFVGSEGGPRLFFSKTTDSNSLYGSDSHYVLEKPLETIRMFHVIGSLRHFDEVKYNDAVISIGEFIEEFDQMDIDTAMFNVQLIGSDPDLKSTQIIKKRPSLEVEFYEDIHNSLD